MSSGLDYYKKDTAYRMLRKEMLARYGEMQTERIWEKAGQELEQLWQEFPDIPKAQRRHTHGEIFPRIAMYRTLQEELPGQAMSIMDDAVKIAGGQAGKLIGALVRIPGMKKGFLRVMNTMLKKMFGPEAGFAQHSYPTGKDELKFEITACPYCKYCELCGCPELTHNFCDSDVYCYGNLPGIRFERTQTLGTGGNCCDFRFKLDKQ